MEQSLGELAFESWYRIASTVSDINSYSPAKNPLASGLQGHTFQDILEAFGLELSPEVMRNSRAVRGHISSPETREGNSSLPSHSPGFVVDDYSPLDSTDYALSTVSAKEALQNERGQADISRCGAPGTDRVGVRRPMRPLDELVELMGALADGERVTVADAVARLGGDANRLARLVRETYETYGRVEVGSTG